MSIRVTGPSVAVALIAAVAATPALADITGTIDASITLEAVCVINGQTVDDGETRADFGSIEFGVHNTLFDEADGEVLSGGNAIEIQCSPGVAPTLTFGAGDNAGSGAGTGLRAMAHSSVTGHFVTYDLFSDAGRSVVVPLDGQMTLPSTGAAQTINLYARAFGEGGLVAGAYSDVITVLLEL